MKIINKQSQSFLDNIKKKLGWDKSYDEHFFDNIPEDRVLTQEDQLILEQEELESKKQSIVKYVNSIKTLHQYYCPVCGFKLKYVSLEDEDWFESCWSDINEGLYSFLCTNKNCSYSNIPLLMHHPIRGHKYGPGDSWSISFIK